MRSRWASRCTDWSVAREARPWAGVSFRRRPPFPIDPLAGVPPADDAQKLSVLASTDGSQTMQKQIRWSLVGVCALSVLSLGRAATALPPPRAAAVDEQKEIL